jgi:hypothetical protein
VFEGVFDLVPCLFGVARELIDASLGAQPGVAGAEFFKVDESSGC